MKGRFRAEENADSAIIDGAAMQSYLGEFDPVDVMRRRRRGGSRIT
jgi:hypothetical protein